MGHELKSPEETPMGKLAFWPIYVYSKVRKPKYRLWLFPLFGIVLAVNFVIFMIPLLFNGLYEFSMSIIYEDQ